MMIVVAHVTCTLSRILILALIVNLTTGARRATASTTRRRQSRRHRRSRTSITTSSCAAVPSRLHDSVLEPCRPLHHAQT